MAQFKNREEYEKWKAERQKELAGKRQPEKTDNSPKDPVPGAQKKEQRGPSSSGLLPIEDLFRNSWEIYKQRVGPLIVLYLISVFVSLAVVALFGGAGFLLSLVIPAAKGPVIGTGLFIGILAAVITISWGMAAIVYAVTDQSLGIQEALSRGGERVASFIWLFSISGFIITGGFLLLFIPGVLFLVWFAFGQFILAGDDERGMRALLKSREYVRGRWFDVFLRLFLIWFASALVSAVPFIGPLLAIAFMPYMMIFIYLIYQDLKSIRGAVAFQASTGIKFGFIGAGTLGYLLLPLIIIAVMGASLSIPLMLIGNMMRDAVKEAAVTGVSSTALDQEVVKAYQEYRSAFMAGDIPALKTLLTGEKAKELDSEQAPALIEMAKAFSPKQATVTGTSVTGDTATVSVSGDSGMTATVKMTREGGRWKVLSEAWSMDMNASGGAAPQSEVRRPYEYHRITGTWRGREAGRSSDDWEMTLGGGHDLTVTGPGGQSYSGDAIVEDRLGIEGDSIRVLPGGAIFDIRITASSSPGYTGKISLGSYKLMGDTLQVCGSEPGLMKRSSEFASSGGIRCFEFRRTSGTVAMKDQPGAPSPQPQPAQTGSSFSKQDPGISGEAVVVLDGRTETYPLFSGFFSDTRLKQPSRATVQFQAPAPEHSNARRVELTLDATQTGVHFADGRLLSDNFMSSDKIRIGERTAQGTTASIRWVADGGQIYFPKPSCTVNITSAYSGSPSGIFSGEIRDCAVHSAGIDHQLSSVRFIVRGAASR